jgi:hypothetical protein
MINYTYIVATQLLDKILLSLEKRKYGQTKRRKIKRQTKRWINGMTDKWKDGCIEVKSDRLFAQAPPLPIPPPTHKKVLV